MGLKGGFAKGGLTSGLTRRPGEKHKAKKILNIGYIVGFLTSMC